MFCEESYEREIEEREKRGLSERTPGKKKAGGRRVSPWMHSFRPQTVEGQKNGPGFPALGAPLHPHTIEAFPAARISP